MTIGNLFALQHSSSVNEQLKGCKCKYEEWEWELSETDGERERRSEGGSRGKKGKKVKTIMAVMNEGCGTSPQVIAQSPRQASVALTSLS